MTIYTYSSDDPTLNITLFDDAEEAWFWFVHTYKARAEGAKFTAGAGHCIRPCEAIDILKIVDRLYRNCRLSRDHIYVMRHYGLRNMAPDKYHPKEQKAYYLWYEAMKILTEILEDKGVIERKIIPFPHTYHDVHISEVRT
ncbi:MAG: hypothetical protein CL565_05380 [Alphaproteobacteria bacterium]|nr:hypothetical protein [Alphaproteobacteria bacterium]